MADRIANAGTNVTCETEACVVVSYAIEKATVMAPSSTNQIVLLFDRGADPSEFGEWLSDNGFVAWRANDIKHAIEELSDFTVRRRRILSCLRLPVFSSGSMR